MNFCSPNFANLLNRTNFEFVHSIRLINGISFQKFLLLNRTNFEFVHSIRLTASILYPALGRDFARSELIPTKLGFDWKEFLCLTWWEPLLYNDQNMAIITRWRWWWLGCWCSCSLRAGLGPGMGLRFCLWLSFMQIAESCLWEPKIWSPGIPGGIFGRTAQLSSLFCGWGGFWVGPPAFAGYRAVPWGAWVLALWSLLVLPLLICHPLFRNC